MNTKPPNKRPSASSLEYGVGGFDGQNDADADVLPIGEAIQSIVVTSAVPSTLASNTIYFIY